MNTGCAGIAGARSGSSQSQAQTIGVSLSPSKVTLQTGTSQQFVAAVTGSSNAAVSWSGTGGTITTSGLYTAPTSAGTYTITATSAADSSKSATATITVTATPASATSISINPLLISILPSATQQFSANVIGMTNTAVAWSATGGTISASGLYTAPATTGTYVVTATSVSDAAKSASATVTVAGVAPVSVSITPTSTTVVTGGTQQFTASVTGSTNKSVTWSATGGTVSISGAYTAPSTTGTYTVTAKSIADTTKTASATVTVTGTQSLSASSSSLAFGNVLSGNTSSLSVTLTNIGTGSVTITAANFTGGVFSAPGLTLPVTIAAGGHLGVSIQFVPDVSGPFSGSVSFVSDATNSPATVTFSGTGLAPQPHSVNLNWAGSTSTNVVGYYVYRSTVSGSGYSRLNGTVEAATMYTDSTVQSGMTYYYVVTAVDSSGNESAYSNQSVAKIPTP